MENQLPIISDKPTSLSNRQHQNNWTTSLVNILPTGSCLTLTESESTEIAMSLTQLDFEVVLQSEKLFQLKSSIGEAIIFKSICALLKMFSDVTKVGKPLSSSEIILCTDWIIKKYTHESIADFALALKDGIFGGHKFYGSVTMADVKEVMEKYFDLKAGKLTQLHEKLKNTDTNTGNTIIKSLVDSYTNDYSETFQEIFEQEKRESAQKQLNEWCEKMKTSSFNNTFEPFEPQENNTYN